MSYELSPKISPSYDQNQSVQVPKPRLYRNIDRLLKPVVVARGGLSVSGDENLVNNNQGQIFAANHKSNWDPVMLGSVGIRYDLQIYNLTKKELFMGSALSRFWTNLGGIKFDRSIDLLDQPAGSHLCKILESGGNTALYLEGTRYRGEELGPMKKVGALAVRKNAIVYPVAIAGTNKNFGRVHIAIGSPFNVSGVEAAKDVARRRIEVAREIDERLPDEIQKLYVEAKKLSGVSRALKL